MRTSELGIAILVALAVLISWRDWLVLLRNPREKAISPLFLIRLAALVIVIVIIGLSISIYVLPLAPAWFTGAVLVAVVVVLIFTPKWLR